MKKLIPTIAMLLIAAVLMGTSTYAWFSMNTTVSATGMQVTAKSDSVYLLISQTAPTNLAAEGAAEIQSENAITQALTISVDDSQVLPSAKKSTVTNAATAAVATNWYYKVADEPSAAASTKEEQALTTFEGYVLCKTVWVTLAAGSNEASDLKVSAAIASNSTASGGAATFAPVRVVVASATGLVELSGATPSSNTVLVSTLNDETVAKLDIYIYYDGNDSNVYTNNIANLDGASVSISFSVTGNT